MVQEVLLSFLCDPRLLCHFLFVHLELNLQVFPGLLVVFLLLLGYTPLPQFAKHRKLLVLQFLSSRFHGLQLRLMFKHLLPGKLRLVERGRLLSRLRAPRIWPIIRYGR